MGAPMPAPPSAPRGRALAIAAAMLQRTHFPRAAGHARGAPMGPPCWPPARALRVHSRGNDGRTDGAREPAVSTRSHERRRVLSLEIWKAGVLDSPTRRQVFRRQISASRGCVQS
jgi:hypothetical protein